MYQIISYNVCIPYKENIYIYLFIVYNIYIYITCGITLKNPSNVGKFFSEGGDTISVFALDDSH